MFVSGIDSISPAGITGAGAAAAGRDGSALDVLGHDPPFGTGTAERGEVDAALACEPPGERRGLDAAAVRGGARRSRGGNRPFLGARHLGACAPVRVRASVRRASAWTSSPGSPIQAIVWPTGASPSASAICSSTPAKSDSTSWVTLSVSTSKSGSPFSTCSPSDFSHRVTVPDSMPWPSRGSLTSLAMRGAYFPTVRFIAASTSSACGTTNCSITGANASGANFDPTRSIGASSQSKAWY